jgi:hypothetical protein
LGCPGLGLGGNTWVVLAVVLRPVLREELADLEELEERPLSDAELDLPVLIVLLDDFGIYTWLIF